MKELKSYIFPVLHIAIMLCVCAACSPLNPGVESHGEVINVGGVDWAELTVDTKAALYQDADKVDWLIQPLEAGLDIVYGLDGYDDPREAHQDVAILKLTDKNTDPATYSFTYRADRRAEVGEHNQAIWYDNGFHYFQGVYVPDRIRYTSAIGEIEQSGKAPGITTDQSDGTAIGEESALGNYTLLSHYLGMPANFRLTATIERIKLPFRHRLARVVAFVLIDPELNTTLKGYSLTDGVDDPNTTSLRFCNVDVLQGVYDVVGAGEHHVLTPKWTKARKVVPHFDGLRGSYSYKTQESYDDDFKFYYKEGDDGTEELYPTSKGWAEVHEATPVEEDGKKLYKGYTMINYGKVPVYDVIVRPTYTSVDNVMYDEEGYPGTKTALAALKNVIDFELELENGLRYTHKFNFDLNANYQTVIYLRINREHVDYNESGAEIWEENRQDDGWYGVDNANGNTLSKAGSSWQRAYRSTTVGDDRVTDGDNYNHGENVGQYLGTAARWADLLLQAYQGGPHHGDYFILDHNITVDSKLIPKDFVFTGHLDAQDHTISLTNVDERVYKAAESLEGLYIKAGEVYTEWTIPTLYVKHVTPATYWQESELQYVEADGKWYEPKTIEWIENVYYTQTEADALNARYLVPYVVTPAVYYTQEEIDEAKAIVNDSEYVPGRNPEAELIATKTTDDIKTPAVEIEPGEPDYVPTYEQGYTPITTADVKTPAHWDTSAGLSHVPGTEEKTPEIVTYPIATDSTDPTNPTTLEQLQTAEYYIDDQGTRFVCPDLYQYSHNSPAYLFAGLNGTYTTAQEQAPNPYAPGVIWEANVHKERNGYWVPTAGYRAEVLNARMAEGFTLFKPEAYPYTGNVQNCCNGSDHIPDNTPDIPRYK